MSIDFVPVFILISKAVEVHRLAEKHQDPQLLDIANKNAREAWDAFEKITNCDINLQTQKDLAAFFQRGRPEF